MNRAPEDQKTGLMAAVLTHMVEQRIAMDARKAQMDEVVADAAHDAAHADGQGIHVAVPDDEGHEGYGRKVGGRLQGTTRSSEMIAERHDARDERACSPVTRDFK